MMIRWVEDGVERVLEKENVAIQGFDSIKCELRFTLWDREPWMEEEIVVRGSEAHRLNEIYGISDAASAEVIRRYMAEHPE